MLAKLWAWFVVAPFHAPDISVPTALGLSMLVNYTTRHGQRTPYKEEEFTTVLLRLLFECIGMPLLVLAFGWLFHSFQ